MQKQIEEILYLAKIHGFDVEAQYTDGETVTERAITLEELSKILSEVFLIPDNDNTN
jgi:hypothetical protein